MPALHHALLGISVVALAAAGFRLASRFADRGLGRAIAAAAFAAAAAVGEAILLGLVALGGSSAALAIAALATWAAARAWLPRPRVALGDELLEWWRARSRPEQAALGALAGAAGAWAAWQLRHPALGFDTLHYHLPEMVIFVQGGQPGSIHDILPGLPVGNYPLTTEVTIAWAMAIARSFVPLVLLPWLTLTLTGVSGWVGLRAIGAPRTIAALATAALCTNPWLLGWQSNGSVTDPFALAWLVACAALCVLAQERVGLLVPAVVAGGLAIGCKTTVLPYTAVVLAIGLWRARGDLPWKPLAAGVAAATLVGGGWYLRNLVSHGSPFWPIVATPWGDPVPRSVAAVHTSFLDRPRATIDLLGHAYLSRFGGGLLLLGAGVLSPLAAPRSRRVLVAAAAVLAGFLVWALSPVTGIAPDVTLPETIFSTTRYALPVVAAACLALSVAAAEGARRLRPVVLLALAAAVVVNLVQTLRLDFPVAPSPLTPLAGAVLGAAGAVAAGYLLRTARRTIAGRLATAGWATAAAAAGALLAIPADGFLARHAAGGAGDAAHVAARLAADPEFRDGANPVATTRAYIGPLAGDSLRHRLELIPSTESCAALARRAESEWVVVYGGPLGTKAPAGTRRCLPPPVFDQSTIALYRPRK